MSAPKVFNKEYVEDVARRLRRDHGVALKVIAKAMLISLSAADDYCRRSFRRKEKREKHEMLVREFGLKAGAIK